MIQSELFESIISLQEAGDEEMDPADRVGLLASAAKNIATLTRSSVTLKKFQAEAEQRGREQAPGTGAAPGRDAWQRRHERAARTTYPGHPAGKA
ncbi:DUF3486 family protein [Pseudomonas aeruginosa]|nr:DUF3486 family protein [Pseudomonas aeruginosa]